MINTEEQARAFCSRICGADMHAMVRLEKFTAMLKKANGDQNLVAASSLDHLWQRHIADSLQLFDYVPRETSDWLDLGSGAGFPGLAIAITRPDLSIRLVESRKRRIAWLNEVIDHFKLANCTVEGQKLESVVTKEAGIITARAFAPLTKLLRLAGRFSTHSTLWLLPKGRSGAHELAEQGQQIQSMFHVEQSKTDLDAAILVGKGRPDSI